jgi:hypothetical protein
MPNLTPITATTATMASPSCPSSEDIEKQEIQNYKDTVNKYTKLAIGEYPDRLKGLKSAIWHHKTYPKENPRAFDCLLEAVIRSGNIQALQTLIAEDVITKKMRGSSEAVVNAICYGSGPLLKALITNGFEISKKSKGGITPLEIACRYGAAGAAATLLKAGAKPDTEVFTDLCDAAIYKREQTMLLVLNEYDLKLLRSISKGEIEPITILMGKNPEIKRRWGRKTPAGSGTHSSAAAFIKSMATKLLKEKKIAKTIKTITKTEEIINL